MDLGERLRQFREFRGLSQGNIEDCFVATARGWENGQTAPSVETLERLASALEVPLYQFLYEGEKPPKSLETQTQQIEDWASRGKGRCMLSKLQKAMRKMSAPDRALLLSMATKMVGKKRRT